MAYAVFLGCAQASALAGILAKYTYLFMYSINFYVYHNKKKNRKKFFIFGKNRKLEK